MSSIYDSEASLGKLELEYDTNEDLDKSITGLYTAISLQLKSVLGPNCQFEKFELVHIDNDNNFEDFGDALNIQN
jgi:hypothetical protein